jgi:hypothetical protein
MDKEKHELGRPGGRPNHVVWIANSPLSAAASGMRSTDAVRFPAADTFSSSETPPSNGGQYG